ncbi:flagellar hook assembly protein FlgD [Jeotgalibacillus marinus]|uniref:Basal-body rod modification protein FlgD n=1 Tax=Jeotgalibacillus marinus TaxID=86667 RepID=A0ABV3Q1R7_9BACL
MNVNTVNSDLFLSSQGQASVESNDTLGKDAFLKLLVAQLTNQDPTAPMDDTEFIAQLASFSTLEQMTNMAESFEKFAEMQEQTQLIQYNEFVGKEVKWDKLVDGEEPTSGRGIIASIRYVGGFVEFELTDGTLLEPGNISGVYAGEQQDGFQQASMLIGKKVSWIDDEDELQESIVTYVSRKDGAIWLHTEDDQRVSIDELTQIAQ